VRRVEMMKNALTNCGADYESMWKEADKNCDGGLYEEVWTVFCKLTHVQRSSLCHHDNERGAE